jgi:hypothetical protein
MKRATVCAFLIACGTTAEPTGPETLPDLEVPEPPEHGVQVITPIVRDLQPGNDYEICTWTEHIFDAQTDVKATTGFQTEPPGHHVILFYTLEHQEPGTQRVCTDTDMATFRYLTGNGTNGIKNEAPGDLIFRIPEGAQLVVNHHYLNAYDTVLDGQSLINVDFAPAGDWTPSGSLAFVDTAIQVQPGEDFHEVSCTLDRDQQLWYLIPHMHRWGTRITVDVTRNGVEERFFDTPWDDSFTFHPPELRMDPTTPMSLSAGDKVDVRCEWNNDTGRVLPFGFEMCVAFAQTVDVEGRGGWACDGGFWTEY